MQEEIELITRNGPYHLQSFCRPADIRKYKFNPQFGTHAHYRSLYTRRESLERNAEQPDANVTLALDREGMIVGFGVLAYPDASERWSLLEGRLMMEVKAVEVCREWRALGVGKEILNMLLRHPLVEEKIVYMAGYSWTWDLDGTGKSPVEYRRMLIGLFEPFGFIEYQTNEPNICLKSENIFMGRVGKIVGPRARESFKWLRFGMDP